MKIITWINFAAFILGVAGLGGAFIYRSKIFDAVLDGVKKELPSLVQGSMPDMPQIPKMTGGASLKGVPLKNDSV